MTNNELVTQARAEGAFKIGDRVVLKATYGKRRTPGQVAGVEDKGSFQIIWFQPDWGERVGVQPNKLEREQS